MKFKFALVASTFVLLATLWTTARAQVPLKIERAKVFARYGETTQKALPLFPIERGIGKVFEQTIIEPGASSLRLHFQVQSAPQARSWAVRILDTARNQIWSYSSVSNNETDFWSGDLPKDRVIVEIYSVEKNSPLKLAIDRVAKSVPPVTPKAITLPDQRASIDLQSNEIKQWGRSVARLRFVGDDGGQYVCTGFLVSSDLLMTNHHCIQSDNEMRSALVDFDYDSSGTALSGLRFKELIEKDSDLDFALLRLVEATDRQALRLNSASPNESQALLIIQHPAGEPKQVSILDCRVQNAQVNGLTSALTDFGHLCDTLGGSSGSPVQDIASGNVIGLHHLGFRTGSDQLFNQAVRIGLIIEFLRARRPDVLTEMGIQ